MSSDGKRVCAGCALDLPKAYFSTSQWSKKGVGLGARCRDCVVNCRDPGHMAIAVRRSFSSTQAVLDKGNPFASGTFRLVAKGLFTDGDRQGQMMVAKWFKRGLSKEAAFFNADIEVNIRARNLLAAFATIGVCSRPIRLNDTEIWYKPPRATYRERGRWRTGPSYLQHAAHEEGKRVLVEAFIPGWEKFNSNSGWVSKNSSSRTNLNILGALSHFSYHYSSGHYLLCDLQGCGDSSGIILSDCVINSTAAGRFGPSDLGPDGISTFFRCGRSLFEP